MRSSLGSINEVLNPKPTPDIPEDYVRNLPYSASLVTINDRKPILMILAYVDEIKQENSVIKRLTWVANDGGSITTENGRIIQTTGLNQNNLANISNIDHLTPPKLGKLQNWTAIYDWDNNYQYNFSANVTTQSISDDTVKTFLWQQDTQHIIETVNFSGLAYSFNNQFWIAPRSDNTKTFTVKSIQQLGPKMDKVQMLMIRPYIEFK